MRKEEKSDVNASGLFDDANLGREGKSKPLKNKAVLFFSSLIKGIEF